MPGTFDTDGFTDFIDYYHKMIEELALNNFLLLAIFAKLPGPPGGP